MSKATLKTGCWSSAAALALALAAGCNLAPRYTVPPVATPPAYKETNDWKTAEPADAVIKGKWWEMFNDPQLNALEDQVVVSNQNIAAALENFLAARAVAKQARSQFFPTVTADPSFTKAKASSNGGSAGAASGSGGKTYSAYALPLDASWEPDLWGAIRNTFAGQAAHAVYGVADMKRKMT